MKKSTMTTLRRVVTLLLPLVLGWWRKRGGGAAAADGGSPRVAPTKARKRVGGPTSAERDPAPTNRGGGGGGGVVSRDSASPVGRLHAARQSDQIITDTGIIVKILPDDNEGSRHQRLLVEVDRTDITIKIAHNIDLAPRVVCREGDRVKFKGEYEYNELGGALHWTHHDPKQWREGGWVEVDGKRYE